MDQLFTDREIADGVRFHGRRSDLRKTDRLLVAWVGDLDASDVTQRAMLPAVMLRGTRSYPDRIEVAKRLEHLFGTSVVGGVLKSAHRHVMYFRADFPSDRFLESSERIRGDVLDFLAELMHEPHFDGDAFPSAVVDAERAAHRKHLEALIDDRASYAHRKLVEHMHPNDAFRLHEYGRVEDLDRTDGSLLHSTWKSVHSSSPMHIYFGGSVEPEVIEGELGKIVGPRQEVRSVAPLQPLAEAPDSPREIREGLDVQQSIIALGYRTGCRHGDPDAAAMTFMNGMFGGFSHSKLFQNVREKASLCYSIHSSVDRAQGLMFAQAGVSPDKVDEARALIEKQLEDLREGKIDEQEEFQATRLAFENRLEILEDSVASLMSVDLSWRLSDAEFSLDDYRQRIAATTKEQVVEAARKVQLDSVFVLEPSK